MVRIQCTDGEYFDIGIAGYEFPDADGEYWDANWLNISLDIHSTRGTLKKTQPAFLTTDVREIIQWLGDLASARPVKWNPLRFTEPNLGIEHVGMQEDRWLVQFRFSAEFKPTNIPRDEDFLLTAELTLDDINRITASLEQELSMYPERARGASESRSLRRRVRVFLTLFIVGLVLSGLTAIPIQTAMPLLQKVAGEGSWVESWWPAFAVWISHVDRGVAEVGREQPFLFYGTDWLAFGHIAIAVFFLGPLRDPVRNLWVIHAGMIACILVIPWALVFGPIRGIPFFWQLIDCSFGVIGVVPLYLANRYIRRIAELDVQGSAGK